MSDLGRIESLTQEDFRHLLTGEDPEAERRLFLRAHYETTRRFGRKIFVRGLIEISNICRNDCYYCGLRRSNRALGRYRLSREEILEACRIGYGIGFRTFVLQGGEDLYWRGARLVDLVREIKGLYGDCALTLSLGEMEADEYRDLYRAGADRYLLRHETHNLAHYARLHPPEMSGRHRLACLRELKAIGFQTGTGIMVGSPGQTVVHIAEDLAFIADLRPEMIGVGPFLTHKDTPFRHEKNGSLDVTLRFIALCRLICPDALIPATTAVATLHPEGRSRAILSGSNVVMPNLSPPAHRRQYALYDDKACLGSEAAEGIRLLAEELHKIDYEIDFGRGDYAPSATPKNI